MALTEKDTYQVEVTENECVQVRKRTIISRDGEEISSALHRHVVCPGDDYSGEIPKVRDICQLTHTPEVIAAYQESLEEA